MEGRLELNGLDNLDLVLRQAISLPNEVEKAKEITRRRTEAKEQGIPATDFNRILKAVEKQADSMKVGSEGCELTIKEKRFELPPGYSVFDNAIYNDNEKIPIEVITHPLAVSTISENVDTGHTKVKLVWMKNNRVSTNFYDADRLASKQKIIDLANQLDGAEAIQSKLAKMLKDTSYTDAQKESIQKDKDAADKAVSLLKDQMQKKFSKSITYMQSYLDSANEALTMVGNRSSRVKLVENRLSSQTTTFKTLQSENEDADATEVAVQLSSAQVSYQAALMATSDMIKETLLNYL